MGTAQRGAFCQSPSDDIILAKMLPPQDRLREFIVAVEVLEGNKHYPACLDGILHLGLDFSGGSPLPSAEMREFDPDLLKTYLVTFRRFTLSNDACFLPSVLHAAATLFKGTKTETRITKAMNRIKCIRKRGYPVSLAGHSWPTLQPEEMFNIWIYGKPDGFHYDPGSKYRQHWDTLATIPGGQGNVAGMVLQYVRALDREVRHLKKLVLPCVPR